MVGIIPKKKTHCSPGIRLNFLKVPCNSMQTELPLCGLTGSDQLTGLKLGGINFNYSLQVYTITVYSLHNRVFTQQFDSF